MDEKEKMNSLSIITVCFNASKCISDTINSALFQKFDSNLLKVEYIVVDGASTDNTVRIVSQFKGKMRENGIELRIISQKDNGIYDAMNKGISLAQGEWVFLLNAGDTFYNDCVLSNVFKYNFAEYDILYGCYNRLDQGYAHVVYPPDLNYIRKKMIFCHQAVFFKTKIHQNFYYNLKYSIVADYDAILRMYLSQKKFKYVDQCIVNYDVSGLSANRMLETHKQIYTVRKNNLVIENHVSEYLLYLTGAIKRVILATMPQGIRWKIVKIKNLILNGEKGRINETRY